LKVRLGLFLASMFLIFLGIKVFSDPFDQRLTLYLQGKALGPECAALREEGSTYINLSFLRRVFHVTTNWRQTEEQLYFKLGKVHYTFYNGSKEYVEHLTESAKCSLKTALFIKDGQLWLPLEFFLKLGLKREQQTGTKLLLSWKGNYLLEIENTTYKGRPAFLAEGSRELKATGYFLKHPDRFVCKLTGTQPYPTINRVFSSHYPGFKSVRLAPKGKHTTLIVFKMDRKHAIKILRTPGDPNSCYIVPNYEVTNVALGKNGAERKILIKTSAPAEYQYQLDKPNRKLVIIFSGADLTAKAPILSGDGGWVKSVRAERMENHRVKITVKLRKDDPCFVVRSLNNPGLVEVKSLCKITAVNWIKTESGWDLTLSGDGGLSGVTDAFAEPGRLRIDLEQAQWRQGLNTFIPAQGAFGSIQLLTPTASMARLLISSKYLNGYDLEISPDGRRVTYHLQYSPLVGQIIVIDPGHGGIDFSACGKQDTWEKTVNNETAVKLQFLLAQAGAKVILSRTDDTFIGLYERSHLANNALANLFISIHANFGMDPQTRGMELFYYPGDFTSKLLAEKIAEKLQRHTGFKNLGVFANDFAVLRETNMPSVLIELGYLSNFQEEALLRTDSYQKDAAWGIFQGIIDYYKAR
jgi:N-acetylmuramoyl-L-alanine amidase